MGMDVMASVPKQEGTSKVYHWAPITKFAEVEIIHNDGSGCPSFRFSTPVRILFRKVLGKYLNGEDSIFFTPMEVKEAYFKLVGTAQADSEELYDMPDWLYKGIVDFFRVCAVNEYHITCS